MLTNNDLKQIGNLIETKTRQIVKEEIKPVIKEMKTMREDLNGVKKEVKTVAEDLNDVKKDITTMKKDIVKIKRDINTVISHFDREHIGLRKRVDNIEDHTGIAA